jgi:hypothetical protein
MSLLPIIQWLNHSTLATSIDESDFVFPLIETVHVLAITLLAGNAATVDLRLLGVILKREKVSDVGGAGSKTFQLLHLVGL